MEVTTNGTMYLQRDFHLFGKFLMESTILVQILYMKLQHLNLFLKLQMEQTAKRKLLSALMDKA